MSQKDRDYTEKRDFIRMRMGATGTLSVGGQEHPMHCQDLSATGMQVEARTQLSPGDKVQVRIDSGYKDLPGLKAEAEVVRVAALEDGRQSLGLAILSMS